MKFLCNFLELLNMLFLKIPLKPFLIAGWLYFLADLPIPQGEHLHDPVLSLMDGALVARHEARFPYRSILLRFPDRGCAQPLVACVIIGLRHYPEIANLLVLRYALCWAGQRWGPHPTSVHLLRTYLYTLLKDNIFTFDSSC